jgi:hypothetical protein
VPTGGRSKADESAAAREAAGIIDKIASKARTAGGRAKNLGAAQKSCPGNALEAPRRQCRPLHAALQHLEPNSSRICPKSMVKISFTSFCYAKPILLL